MGELSSPSRYSIANYFFSNTSSIVFLAIKHSFSKLSTVIYFLQILLYSIKTKFYVIISAFGFAIVCCRYNDENTRIYICKMTNHLCWLVGKKKMSVGVPDSQKLTFRFKRSLQQKSQTNSGNHLLLYSYTFCLSLFFKLASLGI